MDFTKLKPALVQRRMPRNGANSSEDINDFIEQSIHDVASVYNFVNNTVIPAFNGLGDSGTWVDIDPITNGIDGTTVMVSRNFSDTSSPYFYDLGRGRPKTIFESILKVVSDIDSAFIGINEVKARLGTTDTDSGTPTSQATLSEIETRVNFLNSLVVQMRNSNAAYLTAAQIASGLADNSIDPSTFNLVNNDVSSDAGILATKISGVDLTTSYTYTGGIPATYDNRDTILRLKEWFEDFTGETFIQFSGTNVTLSGAVNGTVVSHISSSGTGAVTATNAHGLDVSDLSDTNLLLSKPFLLASFDVHPSGNSSYAGGYAYVPTTATINRISLTLGIPGTTAKGVVLWKNDGSNSIVSSGGLILSTTPTPGAVVKNVSEIINAGTMLFVSGIVGNGLNARVQVFGYF